jgi:drug/metabolite transporter (DMT)-like permease
LKIERAVIAGVAAGTVLALLWSSWVVITRHGVTQALTIYDLTAFRFGIPALLILPFAIRQRWWRGLTPLRIAVVTLGAGVPYAMAGYTGITFAPAAHIGVFLNGLAPGFTVILGWLWVGSRITRWQAAGIALLAVGGALIGLDGLTGAGVGFERAWLGDLILLGAATLLALYLVAIKVWALSLRQILFTICLVSGALYVPVWALALPSGVREASWQDMALQGGFQGVVPSLIGTALIFVAVRGLGSQRTAVFVACVPVLAALMAIPALGELPTVAAWIGIAVTTAGVLFAMGVVGRRMGRVAG